VIRSESGVALLAAMFALAVIGALVAGSFFAGRLEQQSGQNVFFAAQAREAAEAGLVRALAEADAAALAALPAGGTVLDLGVAPVGDAVTVRTSAARLTSRLFLLRAQGTRHNALGGALATRTLGLLVEVPAPVEAPAAEPGESLSVTRLEERGWLQLH